MAEVKHFNYMCTWISMESNIWKALRILSLPFHTPIVIQKCSFSSPKFCGKLKHWLSDRLVGTYLKFLDPESNLTNRNWIIHLTLTKSVHLFLCLTTYVFPCLLFFASPMKRQLIKRSSKRKCLNAPVILEQLWR